jgi:uncharacterized surface protein with fasciclin (FAS1) repeats
MKKIAVLVVLVLSLGAFTSLASAGGGRTQDGNLVEVLAGKEKFSTLVTLVQKAGLVEALSGESELTVFAPTNEAFERLAERNPELFAAVLADPSLLTAVLLYHVSPGETDSSEIVGLSSVPTLLGPSIAVSIRNGYVRLNADAEDAKVNRADIDATNGIIHRITEVLIPPTS